MKYVTVVEMNTGDSTERRIINSGTSAQCSQSMADYLKNNKNANERVYVTLEKQYLKEIKPDGNKQILMEM